MSVLYSLSPIPFLEKLLLGETPKTALSAIPLLIFVNESKLDVFNFSKYKESESLDAPMVEFYVFRKTHACEKT